LGTGVDENLFAVDDLAERLEHDHRAIAADDAEELVLGRRATKHHVEAQLVAIEREGCWNVADDEERRDAGDRGPCHCNAPVSFDAR
jgi:hypothetical protein